MYWPNIHKDFVRFCKLWWNIPNIRTTLSLHWGTPDMRRPVWVIMIAADALAPNRHQRICNYHDESTVFMSYWYNYANKNRIIVIKEANFEWVGSRSVYLLWAGSPSHRDDIVDMVPNCGSHSGCYNISNDGIAWEIGIFFTEYKVCSFCRWRTWYIASL